jgi:hypothetical protein
MGFYLTGDPDFSKVPPKAVQCLKWAWPCLTEKEAREWASVCAGISDPLEAALIAIRDETYKKYEEFISSASGDKVKMGLEMGKIQAKGQEQMESLVKDMPDDEQHAALQKVLDTMNDLKVSMAKIIVTNKPF